MKFTEVINLIYFWGKCYSFFYTIYPMHTKYLTEHYTSCKIFLNSINWHEQLSKLFSLLCNLTFTVPPKISYLKYTQNYIKTNIAVHTKTWKITIWYKSPKLQKHNDKCHENFPHNFHWRVSVLVVVGKSGISV